MLPRQQALFLAPKVYALKNNEEEIIKIKGLLPRQLASQVKNQSRIIKLLFIP